ncbi:hypothetical protein EYF80_023453 [Liparis tanakae]|uniref:Uncharacterized protein n=1 Tax=Liparis tanakae TaxID=230148 RepID=A0A4Z2HKS7_9TELE|nr:hypothetical protein EYF80_023453 [Liparis tanakae]
MGSGADTGVDIVIFGDHVGWLAVMEEVGTSALLICAASSPPSELVIPEDGEHDSKWVELCEKAWEWGDKCKERERRKETRSMNA